MSEKVIYIKAEENCVVTTPKVRLGEVVKISCKDSALKRKILQQEFYCFKEEHAVVVSILKVIDCIREEQGDIRVINCGAEDFLMEYRQAKAESRIWNRVKYGIISLIIFFGSAFTIMTFHNDIGINDTFTLLYEQVMGEEKMGITELEVSYSIGLLVGMVVFFNHISKKKLTRDPSPIQVEIEKYNDDLISTKMSESRKKGHEYDVS